MPATISTKSGTRVTHMPTNPLYQPIYATSIVWKREKDVPLSERRPKPSDLFANGTTRIVSFSERRLEAPAERVKKGTSPRYDLQYAWDGIDAFSNRWLASFGSNSDYCDMKTLLEIKDQKANLTVSIPELGKTTDMLVDLAGGFMRFLRSLRRQYPKRTLRKLMAALGRVMRPTGTRVDPSLRRPARDWLLYQYGIMPLSYDIIGLSRLIEEKIASGFVNGRVVHRVVSDIDRLETTYNDSKTPATRTGVQHIIRVNRYRYRVDNSKLLGLKQAGFTNPLATIYELTPFSFVLDWIIPVGDYLSSLDALVGVKDLLVIRSRIQRNWEVHRWHQNWGTPLPMSLPGLTVAYYSRTHRQAPVGTLVPRLPRYEPHMSATRWISAAALLRSITK